MKFTPRGRAVLALATLAWGLAFMSQNPGAVAAGTIFTLAVAYGLWSLVRPTVEVHREIPRFRFKEGEEFSERISVRLLSRRRCEVHLVETASVGLVPSASTMTSVSLQPGRVATHEIKWRTVTWGRKDMGPLRLTVFDPLGLFELSLEVGEVFTLRVQPGASSVGRYNAPASLPEPALGFYNVPRPGDGSEFFALREYQSGDSVRRINWRATARSGHTIVNQVTRDTYARIVIILDARLKETLGDLETAPVVWNGRAAASLVAHHDRLRDHITVIVVQDEARRATISPNPRSEEILDSLSEVSPGGGGSLLGAVRQHLLIVRPRSPVYVLTSAVADDGLAEAVQTLLAVNANPVLLSPPVASDGLPQEVARALDDTRREALENARKAGARVVENVREVSALAS